jgi:hypothetical protein
MKGQMPFETDAHSLAGKAAMDLFSGEDLNILATKLVPNYNPRRFDAAALRLFQQKGKQIVTLYAVDKFKQEQDNYPKDKLPVKKFKLRISPQELLRYIKRFDLTLSNDTYDIQDMLVMNK